MASETGRQKGIFILARLFAHGSVWVLFATICALVSSEHGSLKDRFQGHLLPYIRPQESWRPLFGAMAEGVGSGLKLTEQDMKQYDGTDPKKPIYLAINGTIFDVSAAPAFYGPGGHYHHFTGKDASRAWVTECWDSEDQLTWRMDGLEAMYMPKYLDEQMEQTADGDSDIEGAAAYGKEEMAEMAKTILKKMGKVTPKEIERRRKADRKGAEQGVQDRLAHWIDFFQKNDKYEVVGTIILDKDKPEPPEICDAAMKRRPMKGGKLDDMMKLGGKPGIFEGEKKPAPSQMPDFVKENLKKRTGASGGVQHEAEDDEDLVRDEL